MSVFSRKRKAWQVMEAPPSLYPIAIAVLLVLTLGCTSARELHPASQTFYLSHPAAKTTQPLLGWGLEIIHRRWLNSSGYEDPAMAWLHRDAVRVEAIHARLQLAERGLKHSDLKPSQEAVEKQLWVEEFGSPVVSGLTEGSGEYFTRLGVGTPPKDQYLVIDTGSDLSWIQCSPCSTCYQQADPIFTPSLSSSFRPVSCSQPLCSQLEVRGCQNNSCLYQVSYGDGSFTVGNFVQETISFGGRAVPSVGIGCGHDNEGLFVGAAGLLGLGGGSLSFPSQALAVTGGQFSYCLASREGGGSGSLLFGEGAVPAGASFAPLLKNPKLDTFYYIGLVGISVGGTLLQIPKSQFSLDADGVGGVILDSGTAVTRLTSTAYAALRSAFTAGTRSLPTAPAFSLFDTCYSLQGLSSVDVPTVDLHMEGGSVLQLPAANYLVAVDTASTYCLSFAPAAGQLSIIGNLQQQGFRFSFDTAASRLGFAANQC